MTEIDFLSATEFVIETGRAFVSESRSWRMTLTVISSVSR